MFYLIHHFLEESADLAPDKEAVVHGNHRFTYLEIEQRANAIANWLLSSGISKGDRVGVLLNNSVDYVSSYYGVLKAGGVIVPLNTSSEPRELLDIIADCSPNIIISDKRLAKNVQAVGDNWKKSQEKAAIASRNNIFGNYMPEIHGDVTNIYRSYSKKRPKVNLIDQDLASIIYTSGSTGKPKGVMLSHLNVVSNTLSIVSYLDLSSRDRGMVVLPFYYVYGKSILNTHFAVTGTVIIDNRFAFPHAILRTMRDASATGLAGVPSTYNILVRKSALGKMAFPTLRYLTQAGGHMPRCVKESLLNIFPEKKIYIMYGATEASARLSYLDPELLPDKIDSIGKAIPNVELSVLLKDGSEAACGQEGEIVARGSNIMMGYWNDPEETAKALKKGWYHTGDLGYKDPDGFFYLTGRKRYMLKIGTHKVSPLEIEEVISRYPGIREAAVIGVPDDVLGEVAKALIVVDNGKDYNAESIQRYCAERLPSYKIPKEIVFVDSLPKRGAGKILRYKLKELC